MIKELTKEKTSLPAGWEMKTLGDVSDFQRGLTYSGKDAVDFSENIVLRATNIDLDKSCLDFSELKYLNNDFQVKQNKKIVKGGLLICLSSGSKKHLGKVALVTDDYNYAFGGFIGQILPDNQIASKYLFYNLVSESYKKYISELTDGIGINNLKSIDLKSFAIPLPPLPQQKQIVATLDKAFAAIDTAKANAEQNLQNAKELFESYLQNVFENKGDDWEEKRFDKICVLQRGFDLPTRLRKEGKHPLVSSNGITDYVDLWKVKSPGVSTGRSGTIGNVHYIEEDYFPLNTSLYIKEFHGNDERCIYYFLQQFDLSKFQSGAGVPTLNRNNVHPVKVYFPISKEEQKQIANKLDALTVECKKLEAIYTQKIADLEEMKKSVLQKAFFGQLNTIN
jgi:type I restriction enzyme S subunit